MWAMLVWLVLQLQSLIEALHSKDTPRKIAAGFALGSLGGWVPFNLIYSTLILMLLYFLNVNMGFGLIGMAVITIFSYFLDPWAGMLGHWLLTGVPSLTPLWTSLFNMPIFPYTRFNNTVMLGSVVISFILVLPVYYLAKWGVLQYRARWKDKLEDLRIFRWVKASKVFTWWSRVKGA